MYTMGLGLIRRVAHRVRLIIPLFGVIRSNSLILFQLLMNIERESDIIMRHIRLSRMIQSRISSSTVQDTNLSSIESKVSFLSQFYYLLLTRLLSGYVQSKIISYLSNLSLVRYPLFISRHGESIANLVGHIGGDSGAYPSFAAVILC